MQLIFESRLDSDTIKEDKEYRYYTISFTLVQI